MEGPWYFIFIYMEVYLIDPEIKSLKTTALDK